MNTIEICKKDRIPFDEQTVVRSALQLSKFKFLNPLQPEPTVKTDGYLRYLAQAWQSHCSVILNPNDIWYMIMCELATAINKSPKDYAHLFTTEPEKKQEIITMTDDVTKIYPDLVIEALKNKVPTKVDAFLPVFSTDTPMTRLALNVAFCDMVSPYYSYSTMLCGIPNVEIGGTKEDWELVVNRLKELCRIFTGDLYSYLNRCYNQVNEIITFANSKKAVGYFSTMVMLEKCGSGSQYEMSGWILQFLNRPLRSLNYPLQLEGLHPHTSKMEYKNLETGRTFIMFAGVLYSTLRSDGFLIPNYNAFIRETTPGSQVEEKPKSTSTINIELVSSAIEAKTRKLKAQWKIEDDETDMVLYTDAKTEKVIQKVLEKYRPGVHQSVADISKTKKSKKKAKRV